MLLALARLGGGGRERDAAGAGRAADLRDRRPAETADGVACVDAAEAAGARDEAPRTGDAHSACRGAGRGGGAGEGAAPARSGAG